MEESYTQLKQLRIVNTGTSGIKSKCKQHLKVVAELVKINFNSFIYWLCIIIYIKLFNLNKM